MRRTGDPKRRTSQSVALVVAVVAGLSGCQVDRNDTASAAAAPSASPSPTGSTGSTGPTGPTTSPNTTASSTPTPASTAAATSNAARPLLWPFETAAAAADWQQAYHADGSQPWHLDPKATARSFTTGFLGFTDIDQVLTSAVHDDDAKVSVGYRTQGNDTAVAAVIHLVRIGTGPDSPWEVVGTVDSTLTLTTPAYGATVSSPAQVGGQITGVDESIRIQVRQPGTQTPLGTQCCTPAGGQPGAWSAQVTYTGATAPTLTIVASTGGHLRAVERFAITAARPT